MPAIYYTRDAKGVAVLVKAWRWDEDARCFVRSPRPVFVWFDGTPCELTLDEARVLLGQLGAAIDQVAELDELLHLDDTAAKTLGPTRFARRMFAAIRRVLRGVRQPNVDLDSSRDL